MIKKFTAIAVTALAVVAVGSGLVSAQGADASTDGATDSVPENGTPENGAASAGDATGVAKSNSDKLAEAKAGLATIEQSAARLAQMARDARNSNDVVKQNCIDEKRSQIEMAKRNAGERVSSMEGQVEANNADGVERDHQIMNALAEICSSLAAQANQCIGQEKGFVGGASLSVTTSPDIPKSETVKTPGGWIVSVTPVSVEILGPPPVVSPLM